MIRVLSANMEVLHDFTGKTAEQVLLSYTAYKGWRTRNVEKVNQLIPLQTNAYSNTTEVEMKRCLANVEKYTDILSQQAQWLRSENHANADEHIRECATWEAATKALITRVLALIHGNQPGVQAPAVAVPAPNNIAKPISDLKPSELAFDASVAHVRRWKVDFTAYHSSSNMRVLPLTNQQAFFNKCIDDDLSARVSRLVTATTPIFPTPGFVSCFDIIDEFFKERNPVLMRRKAFFTLRQTDAHHDELSFMEDVRRAADEGDLAGMTVEDAICLEYVLGVKDDTLRDKLSEVQDPNIAKFTLIMKSYVQSKITARELNKHAVAVRAVSAQGKDKDKGKGKNKSTPPRQQLSDEEKKRRSRFKGRCFRCGSTEHMQPNCGRPSNITCNVCSQQGHMSPVCSKSAVRSVVREDQTDLGQPYPQQLALDYNPAQVSAVCSPSRPTPQVPL